MKINSFIDNGNEIHYRWVYVEELGEEVRVGIDEEYDKFMSKDSCLDDLFSCYVPKDVFENYDYNELMEYVETNMYS
jgi:hypothetical protein